MAKELKPIRAEADYDTTMAEVATLWGGRGQWQRRSPGNSRPLIDACEARDHPVDPPDPAEAIEFRMEQQGLTRKDPKTRKRSLSIGTIRRLHERLGISAEVPIRPSRKQTA